MARNKLIFWLLTVQKLLGECRRWKLRRKNVISITRNIQTFSPSSFVFVHFILENTVFQREYIWKVTQKIQGDQTSLFVKASIMRQSLQTFASTKMFFGQWVSDLCSWASTIWTPNINFHSRQTFSICSHVFNFSWKAAEKILNFTAEIL